MPDLRPLGIRLDGVSDAKEAGDPVENRGDRFATVDNNPLTYARFRQLTVNAQVEWNLWSATLDGDSVPMIHVAYATPPTAGEDVIAIILTATSAYGQTGFTPDPDQRGGIKTANFALTGTDGKPINPEGLSLFMAIRGPRDQIFFVDVFEVWMSGAIREELAVAVGFGF